MKRKQIFILTAVLLIGCGSDGVDGDTALVNVVDEPGGSACEFGGVKVEAGVDSDRDGQLGTAEIEDTRYVCNGRDGSDPVLTSTQAEEPGENCEAGGVRIDTGTDLDRDGVLSDEEVEQTHYVCNGVDGAAGADGEPGTDGVDGTDGTDGTDGISYLVATAAEVAGANCPVGGLRVETGADDNANGVLDASEVTSTEYLCDGEDGVDGSTGAIVATGWDDARKPVVAGADVTLVSAAITTTGPGTIVAFGQTDAFCTTQGGTDHDCNPTLTSGWVSIVDSPTALPNAGDGSFFHLNPDTTESLSRSATFQVTQAGTQTIYLRGSASLGEIGFWRNNLTLVFLPE